MSESLANKTEEQRATALSNFQLLRPFFEEGIPLTQLAKSVGLSLRTARRWVSAYRRDGLMGLCRKTRTDKGSRHYSTIVQQLIEGLALQKPHLSAAAIYRKVAAMAKEKGESAPSYSSVYACIQRLEPALLTLAHAGTKAYSDSFDLLHRHEAEAANATWQADHSLLDIWLLDERNQAKKPWLTIILDDYSRAVAGYFISFFAPSALQTALALRQAIWRKADPAWHICGIPSVLYTDHGSDFTSQHLEQAAAELKIRLIFSGVGKPRGRGKIERFFETVNQMFLSQLPGYAPPGSGLIQPKLTLSELTHQLEPFLIHNYNQTPHSATKVAPQIRWQENGFLPQMPQTLEQLDLLLLTVAKGRRVQRDGIRFQGLRYIDLTLSAYVGEEVTLRYDPRDLAEIRIYHQNRFLCRAICQELAGQTVGLKEIIQARHRRRRQLQLTIKERRSIVDSLLQPPIISVTEEDTTETLSTPTSPSLKRYINE